MSGAPVTVKTLAVFIDADNLNEPTALDHVLADLRQRAERVLYKRAYGRAESLKLIEPVLSRHGVRPVANMVVNKVTTDSALVIDAVEAACTNKLDAVAICSGDADFVPLATWLREKGCLVWCFSLADRIFANPESFYDDVAVLEVVEPPSDTATPAKDSVPAAVSAAAVLQASESTPLPADVVQRVLQAFPALLGGQPQQLNQVVSALRQAGVLGQNSKTVTWFRQHAPAFRLYPELAPNRIAYTTGLTAQVAAVSPVASLPAEATKTDPARDKAAAVRGNTPLLALLRKAVLAVQDDGGWAAVSSVRTRLGAKAQFDTRVHGYPTLTKLLEAAAAFDLRDVGTPQVAVRAKEQYTGQPAGASPSAVAVTASTA
ncbi:MAG: NYN domain-containing protein [Proteobacteria bacterium]|nr:NYN domain-containing protein [Pseudomonadota bacterium]MBS0493099.1 NYN domain-containing protein [Pseudomonadota bacterium]